MARRELLIEMAQSKQAIDQMLEDTIFRLLVEGSKPKEGKNTLSSMAGTVRNIQSAISGINLRAVHSVESLQSLYEH